MKLDIPLCFKILVLQAIYLLVMYFVLLFAFFLYFGSGAESSSSKTEFVATVTITIMISLPIIFNIYKIFKLKKLKAGGSNSYFISTIILISALLWLFCSTDLFGS